MIETRVFLYFIGPESMPDPQQRTQSMGHFSLNFDNSDVVASLGEGWQPISHTLTPQEDGLYLVSVLVTRPVQFPEIPDSLESLGDLGTVH